MSIKILPDHFDILDKTKDPGLIRNNPLIQELKNAFVDTLNLYLPNLQNERETHLLKRSARSSKAFTYDIHTEPHHWYIFNSGGLNEIQYNVGMSPYMIRYGLGIFLGKRKNVEPQKTEKYYDDLCKVINKKRNNFDQLVRVHKFRLEWMTLNKIEIVPNSQALDVTAELLSIKEKYIDLEWLFVGKILQLQDVDDKQLIFDPVKLDRSVKSVCRDLWEYYKLTIEV